MVHIGGVFMTESVSRPGKSLFTVRELVIIPLMAVLMAVFSWISVPMEVPFTLQTFAVFCACMLIGGKNSFFTVIVYMMLGAIGLPVFSGFKSGLGVLLGPTGGYIIGFVFIALIFRAAELIKTDSRAVYYAVRVAALILGTAVCYSFGTAWFIHVYAGQGKAFTVAEAMKLCVSPFIVADLVKMAAAVVLSDKLKKYVKI